MILPALILNNYPGTPYADWVKHGNKTIETRMNRLFSHRGDIIICCGKTNSVGPNAGRALCIVDIYKGRPMANNAEEIKAACIGWDINRKSLLLRNWRHFNDDFIFMPFVVNKNFQGIFSINIPDYITIIPRPDILPFNEPKDINLFT